MKLTNIQKKKISDSMKGKIPWNKGLKLGKNPEHSKKMKGIKAWNKGKTGLQKWSEYQRKVMTGRFIGEKSPCFNGKNIEYFKKLVKIRDNFTCQICGLKDEEISQVDHILPVSKYPELKLNMDNMRVLCPNCHARKSIKEKRSMASVKSWNGLT